MGKRIALGILGALAVVGSLLPTGFAFEIFKDFRNPDNHFWPNVISVTFMCSLAFAGMWLGIRLLRFAVSTRLEFEILRRKGQTYGWFGSFVVGMGFFFPSFLVSLPFTMIWASHRLRGEGQDGLVAVGASFYLGIIGAIVCGAVLLWKRWRASRLLKSLEGTD